MRSPLLRTTLVSLLIATAGLAGCAGGDSKPARSEYSGLQILVASGEQCNACDLYRQIKAKRGYGDLLVHTVSDGQALEFAIKEVDKGELNPAIAEQIPDEVGPASEWWPLQVTIIVVRDGKVLTAGNIAESADLNAAAFSPAVMQPPPRPAQDHPALSPGREFATFFVANLNLEHFVERAFEPSQESSNWLDGAQPIPLQERNLVLWASAANPENNGLFISERISEISSQLQDLRPGGEGRPLVLYAGGGSDPSRNTSYRRNGQVMFKNIAFAGSLPATDDGLANLFSGIKQAPEAKTLLVQVGHSGQAGAPAYGSLAPVSAEKMLEGSADRDLVMVSGACYGGQFAPVARCGFFAAHPDVLAVGCQKSEEAIRKSDDYLRHFFRASTAAASTEADANADGEISFAEAHWYAAPRVEHHELPYTSFDGVVEHYFARHPDALPEHISVQHAKVLSRSAPPEEQRAFELMSVELSPDYGISLGDLVARNEEATQLLHERDAHEWASQQRSELLALSHRLALGVLVKRFIYRDKRETSDAHVAQCEAQSLRSYL